VQRAIGEGEADPFPHEAFVDPPLKPTPHTVLIDDRSDAAVQGEVERVLGETAKRGRWRRIGQEPGELRNDDLQLFVEDLEDTVGVGPVADRDLDREGVAGVGQIVVRCKT